MGGRASRNKGRAYEQVVAYEYLEPLFGEGKVRRGRQSREAHDEPDVVLPADVPLWVECQSAFHPNPRAKLAQAREAAHRHILATNAPLKLGVAFLKETYTGGTRDVEHEFVAMYLSDFLALLKDWWKFRTQGLNMPVVDPTSVASTEKSLLAVRKAIDEAIEINRQRLPR